jgi:acetoin utilization protein AcuA
MGLSISSSAGRIAIISGLSAADILSLQFHPGLGEFADYRSILTSPAALAREASLENARTVLALCKREILGYVVLRPPLPGERWGQLSVMREIFCELARGMRGQNIMQTLLEVIHQASDREKLIYYLLGYSWHWDLNGTGRSGLEYRQSIISLVAPYGYKEYPTNDPNVGLHRENIFMARLGLCLSPQEKKAFSRLLFGIKE